MSGKYFRDAVERMEGYVPGFQPKVADFVKLNTNENPYPPSPKCIEAIEREVGNLAKYPDPTADAVREQVAGLFDCDMDNVIIGNGSDEILSLLVRACVEPGQTVSYPFPTYSLYEVLVNMHGAVNRPFDFSDDWSLPDGLFGNDSPLTFVAHPNSPTGTPVPTEDASRLAESLGGVLVVDEAYADFASTNCMELALAHENVVVTRSLSKSYSLAGLRVGFAVASKELIAGLMKVRDSYNVDCLVIAGASAALADETHMKSNAAKIVATRKRFLDELDKLGFATLPSEANFILTRPPEGISGKEYFEALWERLILVRWLDQDRVRECVRITIGTDEQTDKVLEATREILNSR